MLDCHCDTITAIYEKGENLYENSGHIDIKRLMQYKTPVQLFALWLKKTDYGHAVRKTMEYILFYEKELEKNKKWIAPAYCIQDIDKNKKNGRISALLALEGGEALEGSLDMLEVYYKIGVRALTLTWNYRNELADGAGEGQTCGGLTRFGRETVKKMEQLGMLVDVSHLSDAGFLDVVKYTQKPFIASHSNCRALCDTERNLTDRQIEIIAQRGGVIGINMYPPFLSVGGRADVEDVMKHIRHIIALAGEECIGLGCDFDGIDVTPQGICDITQVQKVINKVREEFGSRTAYLLEEGNFLRVMREVMG